MPYRKRTHRRTMRLRHRPWITAVGAIHESPVEPSDPAQKNGGSRAPALRRIRNHASVGPGSPVPHVPITAHIPQICRGGPPCPPENVPAVASLPINRNKKPAHGLSTRRFLLFFSRQLYVDVRRQLAVDHAVFLLKCFDIFPNQH